MGEEAYGEEMRLLLEGVLQASRHKRTQGAGYSGCVMHYEVEMFTGVKEVDPIVFLVDTVDEVDAKMNADEKSGMITIKNGPIGYVIRAEAIKVVRLKERS
jgi:hypothetical protein